jgi:hypothetical protein
MPRKTIRLACEMCSREDMDGITVRQLKECQDMGWTGIAREQTYAESVKTYDDPADAPPGYSVLDWYTHLGICPDCHKSLLLSI